MKGKELTERIYHQMKRDLMLGKYGPNEMYNEQTFAEAAGRLVAEGYLNKYPSKGYVVRVPSEAEVRELRECRYILECGVVDKLIANASDTQIRSLQQITVTDPEEPLFTNNLTFHMDMAHLAGNSKLAELIEALLYLLVRPLVSMRYPSFPDYATRIRDSDNTLTEEHSAIVEALLERDAEKAKALLKDDIYPAKY